jgi:hypothetical protein
MALFDLGVASKLRAYDLLKLKVRNVCHDERVSFLGSVHAGFRQDAARSLDTGADDAHGSPYASSCASSHYAS